MWEKGFAIRQSSDWPQKWASGRRATVSRNQGVAAMSLISRRETGPPAQPLSNYPIKSYRELQTRKRNSNSQSQRDDKSNRLTTAAKRRAGSRGPVRVVKMASTRPVDPIVLRLWIAGRPRAPLVARGNHPVRNITEKQ
jgi:hypothetical protein